MVVAGRMKVRKLSFWLSGDGARFPGLCFGGCVVHVVLL